MKKITITIFSIFLFTLGYLTCMLIPGDFWPWSIDKSSPPLNYAQYLQLTIMLTSSILTLFTIIVALFKDDIIESIRHPKIKKELSIEEDTNTNSESDGSGSISAVRYFGKLDIYNDGSILASEFKLEITKIWQKKTDNPNVLYNSRKPIYAIHYEQNKISISSNGHVEYVIFQITPTKTEKSEQQTSEILPKAEITFADIKIPNIDTSVPINISFGYSAENIRLQEFSIEIKWDGNWQNRITEMKTKSLSAKIAGEKK